MAMAASVTFLQRRQAPPRYASSPYRREGRGLAKMVEEGRYCIDIMQQIASLQPTLILLRDDLEGGVRDAARAGC